MQVEGKAAIVTGGGTGVGRVTALSLAKLGCHVLINYSRSRDDAERTAGEVEALGVHAVVQQADVADDEACRAMVDAAVGAFSRLDILVNNAGATEFIPFEDLDAITPDVWERLNAVNVRGPFQCTRAAVEPMRRTATPDGGEVINVSSIAGLLATGSCIPYAASKAALNNVTVALARTLAPHVRVNAVAPGFITGRWLENGLGERYESTRDAFNERLPLGRVCDPQDVANAIVSIITGSDLVTGQILTCDSGMSLMEPVRI